MFMIKSPQTIELLATTHDVPLPAPEPAYIHDPSVPYRPPAPLTPAQQAAADAAAKEAASKATKPVEQANHGTATFDIDGDDTSKCRLTITSKDKVWTYIFNVRGGLVSSTYDDDTTRKAKAEAKKKADAEAKAEADKRAAWQKGEADKAAKDPSYVSKPYEPGASPTPGVVNTSQQFQADQPKGYQP